jgi:hypothetical protein
MRGPMKHQPDRGGLLHRRVAQQVLGVALLAVGVLGCVETADSVARSSLRGAAWPSAIFGAARTSTTASAAHVLKVKEEGHLHSVGSSGAELLEEGKVSGTIPGKVKVSFNIGATVTAKFTIYANGGGSISGSGGGALHSTSVYSSFGGALKVTGGSGRYAHARGTGTLSGQIDRKTYALSVQADGKLDY